MHRQAASKGERVPIRNLIRVVSFGAFFLSLVSLVCAEKAKLPVREVGGFRCINLASLRNDRTFDLYQMGEWSRASFAMDVWKRHGVPFWYPREAGDVCVAGDRWPSPVSVYPSSAETGSVAKADAQQPGNGAIANANDDDLSTYWYSGDRRPFGKLSIEFPAVEQISSVRFLGWPTGRHAPKDYRVGLLLADGKRREIASVKGTFDEFTKNAESMLKVINMHRQHAGLRDGGRLLDERVHVAEPLEVVVGVVEEERVQDAAEERRGGGRLVRRRGDLALGAGLAAQRDDEDPLGAEPDRGRERDVLPDAAVREPGALDPHRPATSPSGATTGLNRLMPAVLPAVSVSVVTRLSVPGTVL